MAEVISLINVSFFAAYSLLYQKVIDVFRNHRLEITWFVLTLLVALVCSRVYPQAMRQIEIRMFRLANVPFGSTIFVAALSLLGSAGVAALTQLPEPRVHDEFSHLLAADTFASGRLSNPTHPMWEHFQSFHILQKPTYVSKYPPGQGLMLAAGKVVFGYPIVGVWLSGSLACAAIYWLLRGWFRPGIAFSGALLCICQIGVTTYWTQSYWGGMVAAMGGALVFGAARRLMARPALRTSLILIVGLAVLAISRPFEGLVASLPVLVYLLIWWIRVIKSVRRIILQRVFVPLGFGAVGILLGLAYYNFRQTGHPAVTAYQVYHKTYLVQPVFRLGRFQQLPIDDDYEVPPNYFSALNVQFQISARVVYSRLMGVWRFYVGALLSLPLILAFVAPSRIPWLALVTVTSVLLGLCFAWSWLQAHYAAPMTGPLFL